MFQGPDLEKPYQDAERRGVEIQTAIEKRAENIMCEVGTDSDDREDFVEHLFTEVGIGDEGPLAKLVKLLALNIHNPGIHSNGVTLIEMRKVLWEAALNKAQYEI